MLRVNPVIRREDYEAIKSIVGDDPNFPDTFDEWEKLSLEQAAKFKADGGLQQVIINPQKFASWCDAAGKEANFHTLGAFAVSEFGKKHQD